MIYKSPTKFPTKCSTKAIQNVLQNAVQNVLQNAPQNVSKQTKEGQTDNEKSLIRKFCTLVKGVKAKRGVKQTGIKQGQFDFVVIPNRL